jgi:hypothetical protein
MRFGQLSLSFVIIAAGVGCYSSEMVTAEFLAMSNDQDIVAVTTSGLKYSYDAKQYEIVEASSGEQVLRGKAKVYQGSEFQFTWFEGDLPIASVAEFQMVQKSRFYYAPSYILVAAAAIGIAFAIALNGRGFGG